MATIAPATTTATTAPMTRTTTTAAPIAVHAGTPTAAAAGVERWRSDCARLFEELHQHEGGGGRGKDVRAGISILLRAFKLVRRRSFVSHFDLKPQSAKWDYSSSWPWVSVERRDSTDYELSRKRNGSFPLLPPKVRPRGQSPSYVPRAPASRKLCLICHGSGGGGDVLPYDMWRNSEKWHRVIQKPCYCSPGKS